ncbi:ribosome modulation factor [Rhodanobacter lindaniclasticus]|uniref:Ribosome modulation factor n=1 Tax=Rhodanobacter lindaniclasticus TaxID=75310 RepID=A0A4S3KBY2_9GAMM|nr:hypothetical protein B1991_15780 [Rhodanobacter lindaniclasticus]
MIKENQIEYPLKTWIEGHYVRDRGKPQEPCPYRHGSAMALAWHGGWWHREQSKPTKKSQDEIRD